MRKYTRYLLAVGILIFLAFYLFRHQDQLKALREIQLIHLLYIYAFLACGTILNSRISQLLIASFSTRISLKESVLLQNTARILNLIPMQIGSIFRANYLKKKYNFAYTHSVSIIAYRVLLMILTCGLVGLTGIVFHFKQEGLSDFTLVIFFGILVLLSLFGILVPLPKLTIKHKVGVIISSLAESRKYLTKKPVLTINCVIHFWGVFVFTGIRLWYFYKIIGHDLSISGGLILGAVGFGSMMLSITPEALGIREVLLSGCAVLLGIPFEMGITVSMLDRALTLSWIFVVGGISLLWFWYKYPSEFNAMKQNTERGQDESARSE